TFLVAAVNAVLFELLCRLGAFRRLCALPEAAAGKGWWIALQGAAVSVLLGGTLAYGAGRLQTGEVQPGPAGGPLRRNLEQCVRLEGSDEAARAMFEHNRQLSNLACTQQQRPDLIVWSETSLPGEWRAHANDNNVIQKAEPREVQSLIVDRWRTN